MAKKVFYDDDARRRVLGGAKALYDAVKVTMGPKGRNVIISKAYGGPTVTHDGVTVAKGVDLPEDDDETLGYKVGAELIKQAASKMNDVAGDGTTTVTVLTYTILNEANRLIAAGHNPMELRKGVEEAGAEILGKLAAMAEDIGSKKERVAQVATISAGDQAIGTLIADVIAKVGKDGVVTVEEGQGLHLESEVVEGFTMDRGFVSAYMVTDATRMEAVYDKPAVVITDKKISSVQEFLPMLEKLAQSGKKDLVLIADDVEGEVLGTLILNKLKGVFNTVAVKAPAFGDRRKDVLQDLATLTGATVITEDLGYNFENAELNMVGTARKVIVTKDQTTIIEGAGSASEISARIKQIRAAADAASSEYDKENYEKRAAALGGKVAVIKVGGATEMQIEEAKFRVDDAVAATKAALAAFTEVLALDLKEFGINTTVVEPSGFRTGFLTADSLAYRESKIDGYQAVKDAAKRYLDGNGVQPGDPDKASEILIELAESDQPPLHLYLGQDAYNRVAKKLNAMTTSLEEWKKISISADFQIPSPH